jgi:hypothetical protein
LSHLGAVTVSDLDIYRTAWMLIDEHGEEASIEAAMRADKRLEAGDLDGQAVWLRVLGAVKELLTTSRPDHATIQ